jgi:hypothetical protein
MAKLGFIIPRTLSNVLSTQRNEEDEPAAFHIQEQAEDTEARLRRRTGGLRSGDTLPQRVVRIGRSIVPSAHGSASSSRATSQAPTPISQSVVGNVAQSDEEMKRRRVNNGDAQGAHEVQRTIRFPDDQPPMASRD